LGSEGQFLKGKEVKTLAKKKLKKVRINPTEKAKGLCKKNLKWKEDFLKEKGDAR